jgi:endonuclease/exonuclease/phosphatase family metal-dependent hydrolase
MLCVTTRLVCCATTSAANSPLTVVSFNMDGETSFDKVMRDFDRAPQIRNADLFLLQEVAGAPDGAQSIAKDLAARLGMQYVFRPADPIGGGQMKGLAILSRYRFRDFQFLQLKHYELNIRSRDRIALAVTLETPAGGVRVFNLHLDTRVNNALRLAQLEPVLNAADAQRLPCLIGGDFNTLSMYWVGHVFPILYAQDAVGAVRKQMASHGFSTPFGAGITFPIMWQKLDWVYLKGLRCAGSGVCAMPFSDHHAIWSKLAFPQ